MMRTYKNSLKKRATTVLQVLRIFLSDGMKWFKNKESKTTLSKMAFEWNWFSFSIRSIKLFLLQFDLRFAYIRMQSYCKFAVLFFEAKKKRLAHMSAR